MKNKVITGKVSKKMLKKHIEKYGEIKIKEMQCLTEKAHNYFRMHDELGYTGDEGPYYVIFWDECV